MGKDITYINKAGKEISKAEFEKSGGCRTTWDPRPRTWDALITCAPTEEMLKVAGNSLAQKSQDRLEHHIPCEKGSEVGIEDTDPHEFTVKFPSCAISEAHQVSIVKAWATWAQNLMNPNPDDAKSDDGKKDDKSGGAKPDDSKKDDSKPAQKKHFWDMSDEERIAYNNERINFYMNYGKSKK